MISLFCYNVPVYSYFAQVQGCQKVLMAELAKKAASPGISIFI